MRWLIFGAAGAFGLWLARWPLLTRAGALLIAEDPLTPAQVMVVSLASPAADALEAARLYRDGISPVILVPTWVQEPIQDEVRRLGIPILTPTALVTAVLERSGVPAGAIEVLPDPVNGTETEVEVVGAYAQTHRPQSLLVVTARSHSARVRWFLRRALPAGTRLSVRSPRNDEFVPGAWWRSREASRELVTEYLRWLNMLILPAWGQPAVAPQ